MYKYILIIGLLFSACSQLEFNAKICEEIASQQDDMPRECRIYNEKEAQEAFDKTSKTSTTQKEDLKFDKK